MHPQHSRERHQRLFPSAICKRSTKPDQRGLLDLLLEEFPGLLTYREALVASVTDPDDLIEADDFANVAHGLVASGLLVRQGELVIPSRPAREMVGLGRILG